MNSCKFRELPAMAGGSNPVSIYEGNVPGSISEAFAVEESLGRMAGAQEQRVRG